MEKIDETLVALARHLFRIRARWLAQLVGWGLPLASALGVFVILFGPK